MLTKTKSALADVQFLHLLLDQLELKLGLTKRIGIECLIEDVEGLMNVEDIAASSDRLGGHDIWYGRLLCQPTNAPRVSRQHRRLPTRYLALPAIQNDHCVPGLWLGFRLMVPTRTLTT